MDSQWARHNLLLLAAFSDELFGSVCRFARGDPPARDITAENVQNHVQIIVGPFHRTTQFGDVPTPQRIGARGESFRLGLDGTMQLIAALPALAFCFQQPVHRPEGAVVSTFLEPGSLHLRGRAILKALFLQTGQGRRPLFLPETACRRTWPVHSGRAQTAWTLPVIRSAGNRPFVASTLAPYAPA
jgi:hypothetical protein